MHSLPLPSFNSAEHVTETVCEQPSVAHTKHWPGNNIWSVFPIFEAQLRNADDRLWLPLEEVLREMLGHLYLPTNICTCIPSDGRSGIVLFQASEAAIGHSILTYSLKLATLPPVERSMQWHDALSQVRQGMSAASFDSSAACIADAAVQRKLPAFRLTTHDSLIQLGMGATQQRIWNAPSSSGCGAAIDPTLTHQLLALAGIPTIESEVVHSATHAWEVAQTLGLPVIVRPLQSERPFSASQSVHDRLSIEAAWLQVHSECATVLIERFTQGTAHQLLVVGEQVIAAIRDTSIELFGDGTQTVEQLIKLHIQSYLQKNPEVSLPRLDLQAYPKILAKLQHQHIHVHTVLKQGQRITLQQTGCLTSDCTNDVHPEIAYQAVMAARTVGLDIAGVELIVMDISKPLQTQSGAIVAVRANPDLFIHQHPMQGTPHAVGQAICDHLFPCTEDALIPVTGILANHSSAQRIAHSIALWQQAQGYTTGMANGNTAFLKNRPLSAPMVASPLASTRILMHRAVNAAVIAQNIEDSLQHGWAYMQCDLAVIAPDNSWNFEAASTQRVIATHLRNVRPKGIAVLCTGSAELESLALTCPGHVVWVDPDENHPVLQEHRRINDSVVFIRDQQVICAQGFEEITLPLPERLGEWDAKEWLAVVAAGWAMQWPLSTLKVLIQNVNRSTP